MTMQCYLIEAHSLTRSPFLHSRFWTKMWRRVQVWLFFFNNAHRSSCALPLLLPLLTLLLFVSRSGGNGVGSCKRLAEILPEIEIRIKIDWYKWWWDCENAIFSFSNLLNNKGMNHSCSCKETKWGSKNPLPRRIQLWTLIHHYHYLVRGLSRTTPQLSWRMKLCCLLARLSFLFLSSTPAPFLTPPFTTSSTAL